MVSSSTTKGSVQTGAIWRHTSRSYLPLQITRSQTLERGHGVSVSLLRRTGKQDKRIIFGMFIPVLRLSSMSTKQGSQKVNYC